MIIPGTFFRMRIAFTFDSFYMNQYRTVHFLHALQKFNHFRQIVTIYRANIFKAHLLKQCTFCQQHFCVITHMFQCLISTFADDRNIISELFYRLFPAAILSAGAEVCQMLTHCTYIFINRHFVIVQDNNESCMISACIIQRFISQTASHRTITDDSNDMLLAAHQISCLCKPQCRRNRCGTMACRKGIAVTFIGLGKTAEPIQLTQCVKLVFSACQNLMDICLMAYIPYDFIFREVKTIFQSHRQFHHT